MMHFDVSRDLRHLRRRLRALAGPALARGLCAALLSLAAWGSGAHSAAAQGVLIAPQSVIIDHRTRSGTFEVYNPTAQPAEVSISLVYGFPTTDSLGVIGVTTYETPAPGEPSAAAWLQAFPRRFVLNPQERQTVRLLGRPPAGLPDGEYWSRLVVATRGATPTRDPNDSTPVQVAVALEVRTLLGVLYRKGTLRTAVQIAKMQVVAGDDSTARVRVFYERSGTAAYVGTARLELRDAGGRVVRSLERRLAVYKPLSPLYELPIGGLPAGSYWAVMRVATERDDIAGELVLRAPTVRDSVAITIAPKR